MAEETKLLQFAGKKMKKVAKGILFRFLFLIVFCFFIGFFFLQLVHQSPEAEKVSADKMFVTYKEKYCLNMTVHTPSF